MPKHPSVDYSKSDAASPCQLSPLEIILTEMRKRQDLGDAEGAIALARIAAPYIHPRASAKSQHADLAAMNDADLDAIGP